MLMANVTNVAQHFLADRSLVAMSIILHVGSYALEPNVKCLIIKGQRTSPFVL